jgi:stress response protein YsnF
MFISDEEKRQIMAELARGNPEMLTQESSPNLSQDEQKLNDDTRASKKVVPIRDSKLQTTPEKPENDSTILAEDTLKILSQDIVRLVEERLVVNRSKHKIGEAIVRKEIETRIIQVPVRYEKLIVEQVSPERKQLVEINLGQAEGAGIELTDVTNLYPEIT